MISLEDVLPDGSDMIDSQNFKKLQYFAEKTKGTYFNCYVSNNYGWIEVLKHNLTNVYYYSSMPTELFQNFKVTAMDSFRYVNKDSDEYEQMVQGLLHILAQVRLNEKFVMPLFASQNHHNGNKIDITCGLTRFMACLVNGIEANNIPLIVLAKDTPKYDGWQKIETTQQFVELFDLADLDHNIGIDTDNGVPEVVNSIILHSIYGTNRNIHTYGTSKKIADFWKKFISDTNNKIDITISCTEDTKALIQPSDYFNISYIITQPLEWQFSFGKMTGARLDKSQSNKLHLYLFDIVEPVNLNLLLVWPTEDYGTFYSRNHKSILIDMDHESTFVIIGNWVQ